MKGVLFTWTKVRRLTTVYIRFGLLIRTFMRFIKTDTYLNRHAEMACKSREATVKVTKNKKF